MLKVSFTVDEEIIFWNKCYVQHLKLFRSFCGYDCVLKYRKMSAKPRFELGGEFEDKNFASCFARSVVVNSQYKQAKSLDGNFVQTINAGEQQLNKSPSFETADGIRLRRVSILYVRGRFMLNRHLGPNAGVPETLVPFAAVCQHSSSFIILHT